MMENSYHETLYTAFNDVSLPFTDLIGHFGVTPGCPISIDVSALVNHIVEVLVDNHYEHWKRQKLTITDLQPAQNGEHLIDNLHYLQWIVVLHYVERHIKQFDDAGVVISLVVFNNKLKTLDRQLISLHQAVIAHLQNNTNFDMTTVSSPRSEEWLEYVDMRLIIRREWIQHTILNVMQPFGAYATTLCQLFCSNTLKTITHASLVTILIFELIRLNVTDLNMDESIYIAVGTILNEMRDIDLPPLRNIDALSKLVPSNLNTIKIAALLTAVQEVNPSTNEERIVSVAFILQGLLTEHLSLESMAFRGVYLPTKTSSITECLASIVNRLLASLCHYSLCVPGSVPTHYDGKMLHTLISYLHCHSMDGLTIQMLSEKFGIASELESCSDAIKETGLQWILGNDVLKAEGLENCTVTVKGFWNQVSTNVAEETKVFQENKQFNFHPVRQNKFLSDLLLADGEQSNTSDELALQHLMQEPTPWNGPAFVEDHPFYLEVVDTAEEDDASIDNAQQYAEFFQLAKEYIKLSNRSQQLHPSDARPILTAMIGRGPPRSDKPIQNCLRMQHWAGALGICKRLLKLYDAARERQKFAAFQSEFARSLLGEQLDRMNLDPIQKGEKSKTSQRQALRGFTSSMQNARDVLASVQRQISGLQDYAKTARAKRTEKAISDWFRHAKNLFTFERKPILDELTHEKDVLAMDPRKQDVASAIDQFRNLNYRNFLKKYRVEYLVMALEIHLLRLDCHIELLEEKRLRDSEKILTETDPCILDKTTVLAAAVVDPLLDMLRDLVCENQDLHSHTIQHCDRILTVLYRLGFSKEIEKFTSFLKHKIGVTVSIDEVTADPQLIKHEYSLIDFQFYAMGPYFARPDGISDKRSPFFKPDDWQVELLDAVDRRQSALISAPTSSGKTFVSFYAMEQVLRSQVDVDDLVTRTDADLQMVVYVSPTKALVNQTVAEIEGRYIRKVKSGHELAVAFTTEYGMKSYDKCRVLVTIPECFGHLLLLAGAEGWKRRIKWVIFDEIHSISLKDGFFWERALSLIDCPFLALSATIGDSPGFVKWLEELETDRLLRIGKDVSDFKPLVKINHNLRWNDLDTWCYDSDRSCLVTINPLGILSPAKLAYDGFPTGCRVVPEHAFEILTYAQEIMMERPNLKKETRDLLMSLEPNSWFSHKQAIAHYGEQVICGRIAVKKYAEYEAFFKQTVVKLARLDKEVIHDLCLRMSERIEQPCHSYLTEHDVQDGKELLKFVRILKDGPTNRLPALLFHLDTNGIDNMLKALMDALKREQDEHYYFREVESASRWHEVNREILDLARESVDNYRHALKEQVQSIENLQERDAKYQELYNVEVDKHIDRIWSKRFEKMNESWLSNTRRQVTQQISAEIRCQVADGDIPNDPAFIKQKQEEMVEVEVDRLIAKRITNYSLSELPVPLQDIAAAFPRLPMRHLQRRMDSELFYQALRRGIGIHYTAMSKSNRQAVERLFRERKLAIVLSTDTLALGISMPCRTVVFVGDNPALDSLNYHQMSGRAGRRGHDIRGHVVFYGISKSKIKRLLTSPLRQMHPNIPTNASTIARAITCYQQAPSQSKEKERASMNRLLLQPFAAYGSINYRKIIPLILRFQVETLMRLHILTFIKNPKFEEFEKEMQRKETSVSEHDDENDDADVVGSDSEAENSDSNEPEVDSWMDISIDELTDSENKDDLCISDNTSTGDDVTTGMAAKLEEETESKALGIAKQDLLSNPDCPLIFSGPVAGSMGSIVAYFGIDNPNNLFFAHLLRSQCLDRFALVDVHDEQESRENKDNLFRIMLSLLPRDRLHSTELYRKKQTFHSQRSVYLTEPQFCPQLENFIRSYKDIVLSTFNNVFRASFESAKIKNQHKPFPLSSVNIGGTSGLPTVLSELYIRDNIRSSTAAVSGHGSTYLNASQALLETEYIPCLSLDLLSIPTFIDDQNPMIQGYLFDFWKCCDISSLLEQSQLIGRELYSEIMEFQKHSSLVVESIRRRDSEGNIFTSLKTVYEEFTATIDRSGIKWKSRE